MKKKILWILLTSALVIIIHIITIKVYPYVIMYKLSKSSGQSLNTIFHAPPTTAESRRVVRPSPDLLYSACGFDVSEKPLRITAQVPDDSYWSLSIFAENTDNFFILNDRQVRSKKVEVILVGKGKTYQNKGGHMIAEAPGDKGVVLFRTLISDKEKLNELIKTQKEAACVPVD